MAKRQNTNVSDADVETSPEPGGVAVVDETAQGADTGIDDNQEDDLYGEITNEDLYAELGIPAPDREDADEDDPAADAADTEPDPPEAEQEEPEVPEGEEPDDEAEDEAEDEEDAEDQPGAEDDTPEADSKRKPGAEKRIDELTYKLRSAEELAESRARELDEMRAELETARSQPGPAREPKADFFGADADTLSEIQRYEDILAWTERNPNGGVIRGTDGAEIEVEERQVIAAAAEAKAYLGTQRAMGRQRYQNASQLAQRDAATLYPELDQRTSELARFEKMALEAMPSLRARPDYRLWVGRMWRGFVEERKAQQATLKPETPRTPAVKPARPPKAAGVKVKRGANPAAAANRRLAELKARAEAGDENALQEYLESTL